MIWKHSVQEKFLDYIHKDSWTGLTDIVSEKCSFGDSNETIQYDAEKLFAAYFYLSDDIIIHNYFGQNIMSILTQFLALSYFVMIILREIGFQVNT